MRWLVRLIWVIAVGLMPAFACGGDSEPGVDPAQTALFEEYVDAYVAERMEPDEAGIAIAVMGPRGVIFEKAYGMANIAKSLPMTLDTPTELASLSKQFTAMAIMILYEDGKLELDDRVSVFVPEAPPAWDAITIHHLLTHQSGVPNDNPVGLDREEFLAWAMEQPLEFTPGTGFTYSNPGYAVLAVVVDRVAGQPFESFVSDQIFVPLGMEDSSIPGESVLDLPNRALSYLQGSLPFDVGLPNAGWAGQLSSMTDLKRWELELRRETLLSPESFDLIFTRHAQRDFEWGDCAYGYGWNICDVEGWPNYQDHTGELLGYHSMTIRLPEDELAIMMVSNGDYEWAYELPFEHLVDLYLTGEPTAEPKGLASLRGE